MADLDHMLRILKKSGLDETIYYQDQIHSATITAALSGHVDIMLKLLDSSTLMDPEAHAALEQRKARAQARQEAAMHEEL